MNKSDPPEPHSSYFVNSVARAMDIMTAFTIQHPERTVTDLSSVTGLSRPTVRRLLLTLRDLGFVSSANGRNFQLAPRVLELGYSYLSSLPLRDVARPHLEKLTASLKESVGLIILDLPATVCVAASMSPRLTSVRINLGTRFQAHATAAGHILLAHLPQETLETYLREQPELTTNDWKKSPNTHASTLRERGWALVDHELEKNLREIAAVVLDAAGRAIAAVSVPLHKGQYTPVYVERDIIPAVRQTAREIQDEMAGSIQR